jgi:tetratricopeptide (TPR) repeat protein
MLACSLGYTTIYIIKSLDHKNCNTMKIKNAGILQKLFMGILMLTTGSIYAQTIEEAAELFNAGREFIAAGNNKGAIEKLEACIALCDKLGEEADELKQQTVVVIPNLYYGHAKSLFDNNQIDEAIASYKTTLIIAQKYNNTEVYTMTQNVLAQLFLKNGNDKFREKEYVGAIEDLKKSLSFDSTNTSGLLLMGYSYRRLDSTDQMVEYFKATIAAAPKNDRNAPKAVDGLISHYMTTGAKLINAKNTKDGLAYLDTAATFGENGDLYYYYAVGYNAEGKYDEAIAAAEKAITLDPNNKENQAKYNFEIGTAYYAKKDTAKACEAYKSANFGRTALRADQMLKALKCK